MVLRSRWYLTMASYVVVALALIHLFQSATFGQIFNNAAAGVVVDAQGVLRVRSYQDPGGQLTRQRIEQLRATMDPDISRVSKLRKVSLTRLEAVIAERLAKGTGATDDMKYLAGMTQLQYVFYYPETRDIVIAGPAEGYVHDVSGRVRGMRSGRSVLELQDLVVALRCFPPSGSETNVISCSIDPTQEGLARMQQFLHDISGRIQPSDAERIAQGLHESLGPHNVSIQGVSSASHFAQVLVEADYRMKLIGIGLEQPPVHMTTFIQKASPSDVARNALQRWYFVPDYETVRVSEDGYAMELIGEGVKLISENEMIAQDGGRVRADRVDRASQAFARSFTQKYAEIADHSPIYAQLRNLIDMSIAAAFLQQEDWYHAADWDAPVFGDEAEFSVETYPVPQTVESAVNVVWKGSTLMTPIGGGVHIRPQEALVSTNVQADDQGDLQAERQKIAVPAQDPQRWWWD
ncbi:MAG: DUF1598 domain-containing protein [Planctomycetales bacterium]|nr:DUF1598 domain-containing protein [Planctomycetales bacterium]